MWKSTLIQKMGHFPKRTPCSQPQLGAMRRQETKMHPQTKRLPLHLVDPQGLLQWRRRTASHENNGAPAPAHLIAPCGCTSCMRPKVWIRLLGMRRVRRRRLRHAGARALTVHLLIGGHACSHIHWGGACAQGGLCSLARIETSPPANGLPLVRARHKLDVPLPPAHGHELATRGHSRGYVVEVHLEKVLLRPDLQVLQRAIQLRRTEANNCMHDSHTHTQYPTETNPKLLLGSTPSPSPLALQAFRALCPYATVRHTRLLPHPLCRGTRRTTRTRTAADTHRDD